MAGFNYPSQTLSYWDQQANQMLRVNPLYQPVQQVPIQSMPVQTVNVAPTLQANQAQEVAKAAMGNQQINPNIGRNFWDNLTTPNGLQGIASGLGAIGSLWNTFQQNKLAREQFKWQRDFANKNYANSVKNYNTSLETKADIRAASENRDQFWRDEYIRRHQLT